MNLIAEKAIERSLGEKLGHLRPLEKYTQPFSTEFFHALVPPRICTKNSGKITKHGQYRNIV